MTSKTSFPHPQNPQIPNFEITNKEYDDVVVQSKETLSLANIAKNVKRKTKMFQDKVSKLQNNLGILSKPTVGTGISVISCITFCVSALALALSVRVYYEVILLAPVTAATEWDIFVTETPTDYLGSQVLKEYLSMTVLLLIFLTVIVFIGLFKFWSRSVQLFTQNLPHTVVTVNLFGNGDCVALPLLRTSHSASSLKLAASLDEQNMLTPQITTSFTSINIAWNKLHLSIGNHHIIGLPGHASLKLTNWYKVKRILANLQEIQLMALYGDDFHQLHTWHVKPLQQCTNPTIIITHAEIGNTAYSCDPCDSPTLTDNP